MAPVLTPAEEVIDRQTRHLRFDVPLLARRLTEATDWVKGLPETGSLRIGYLGTGVVAAAALIAAAEFGTAVNAVVSRGGRPDLANEALPRVFAPTLLIAGGLDDVILHLNQEALARLHCVKEFKIIPDATHLFEEPGKSEEVALLTAAERIQYEGYLRREEANAAILQLRADGMPIKEIVRRTGHSRGLVRKVLHESFEGDPTRLLVAPEFGWEQFIELE